MESLHSVGHAVGEYVGGGQGDAAPEDDDMHPGDEMDIGAEGDEEDPGFGDVEPDASGLVQPEDSSDQAHPLMFFFDCEATGLSIYDDNLTEIAAKVVGVPITSVSQPTFSSLVHTPRNIPKRGKNNQYHTLIITWNGNSHLLQLLKRRG